MDKNKHVIDEISRSIDANVKTVKRITSLMRELLHYYKKGYEDPLKKTGSIKNSLYVKGKAEMEEKD